MSDHGKRVVRILVTSEGKGKDKVNVTLPLGVAKLVKFGPIAKELRKHDIDIDELLDDIDDIEDGKVIDVTDDKSGDHVEIFIERRRGDAAETEKAPRAELEEARSH